MHKILDKLKIPLLITSIILILAPLLFVCINYSGWQFASFLIVWVFIPGLAIMAFLKHLDVDWKIKTVISFLLGTALIFFEYFVLYKLNLMELIKYINPIISIGYIFYWFKTKQSQLYIPKIKSIKISRILPFMVLGAIFVTVCAFMLNYSFPTAQAIQHADYTWEIGNVNQLASSHPFNDIRLTGYTFKYHFFSTLFFAIAKIIFNADGWVYFTQYAIFFIPFLVCLCLYSLFQKFFKKPILIAFACFCCITGFSFSAPTHCFIYHWATNINAVGFAIIVIIALFFTTLPLLEPQGKSRKLIATHMAIASILTILLAGIKSPFAIVYIVALLVFFVFETIKNKKIVWYNFAFVGGLIVLFGVFYITVLSAGASGYFADFNSYYILNSALFTPLALKIYQLLGQTVFAKIMAFVVSLFATLTICAIPVVLCAIDGVRYLFGKKIMRKDILLASLISAIGLGGYYFFNIFGRSEMYFLFCAIPFVGYISANKIIEILTHFKSKALISITIVVAFSLTIIGINNGIIETLVDTSPKAPINYYTKATKNYGTENDLIFDALAFLKQNTPSDSLVATNRQMLGKLATSHIISAFAERSCFFEGYEYGYRNIGFDDVYTRTIQTADLFSMATTDEEKHLLAKSINIDYLVVFSTERFVTIPENDELFSLIFENPKVTILKVN